MAALTNMGDNCYPDDTRVRIVLFSDARGYLHEVNNTEFGGVPTYYYNPFPKKNALICITGRAGDIRRHKYHKVNHHCVKPKFKSALPLFRRGALIVLWRHFGEAAKYFFAQQQISQSQQHVSQYDSHDNVPVAHEPRYLEKTIQSDCYTTFYFPDLHMLLPSQPKALSYSISSALAFVMHVPPSNNPPHSNAYMLLYCLDTSFPQHTRISAVQITDADLLPRQGSVSLIFTTKLGEYITYQELFPPPAAACLDPIIIDTIARK